MHAESFRVSRKSTELWRGLQGSLTCVRDYCYACVYTHDGLDTPTTSQHNIFDSKKLSQIFCSCAPDVVRFSGLWILSPALYQLSHPVTPRWVNTKCEPGVTLYNVQVSELWWVNTKCEPGVALYILYRYPSNGWSIQGVNQVWHSILLCTSELWLVNTKCDLGVTPDIVMYMYPSYGGWTQDVIIIGVTPDIVMCMYPSYGWSTQSVIQVWHAGVIQGQT